MKASIRTAHLKPTRGKSRWSIRGKIIPEKRSAWFYLVDSFTDTRSVHSEKGLTYLLLTHQSQQGRLLRRAFWRRSGRQIQRLE